MDTGLKDGDVCGSANLNCSSLSLMKVKFFPLSCSVRNKDCRKCACVGGTLTLSTQIIHFQKTYGCHKNTAKTLNIDSLFSPSPSSRGRFFGQEKKNRKNAFFQDALGLFTYIGTIRAPGTKQPAALAALVLSQLAKVL